MLIAGWHFSGLRRGGDMALRTVTTEKAKITELIAVADRLVGDRLHQSLTDVDKIVLEQALRGSKLKDIQVVGYSQGTVERVFAPRLWKLLSQACSQKVGIKNLRLILEDYSQQAQPNTLSIGSDFSENALDRADEAATLAPQELPNGIDLEGRFPQGSLRESPAQRFIAQPFILENLPAPTSTAFIGREAEIERLLHLLSPDHAAHLISIAGIGGVGKTSLAVECARRCLAASRNPQTYPNVPTFNALIFVSAKLCYLQSFGLLQRFDPMRSLQDILQQIADVLGETELAGASLNEQIHMIRRSLHGSSSASHTPRRTLLIIDNLETMENPQMVLSFLHDLPPSVKSLVTTREQSVFVPVRLVAMPTDEALSLIQHEAQEKGVALNPTERRALLRATGGLPVAIHYAIGQLANDFDLATVLQGMSNPTGDVARFCFETTVNGLRGQPSHHLLMALAMFPTPVLRETLFQVADVATSPDALQGALSQLCQLSLVNQQDNRYGMLPLTQEYALAELKAHPDFAQVARQRWVAWALHFSEPYANQEVKTWHSSFDGLQEEWQNLRAIADFCMTEGWYDELLQIWNNVKAYTYSMGRRKGRTDYWGDRLRWTEWLIAQATQRSHWRTLAEVMLDRAWTLTATRKPRALEEADQLFEQIQTLRDYQDQPFQTEWAKKMSVLRTQQQQFDESHQLLDEAEALLNPADWPAGKYARQRVQLLYYRGMTYFKAGQIAAAKQVFETARAQAHEVGWERAVRMTENWLADIAVREGKLDESEQLLVEGLRIAEQQDDPTRSAYVKRSFAELVQARGNPSEAQRWAREALALFEQLGMPYEAEETQAFLNGL
ncbi:AAA family ATPase [Thermoleptolyngbya sp. PKUAC-SCTB121]|uniref:AAA family ATPase n=1 Tax=Thermoleptolyngbya sp. PKUAC-SCTB121 TaxID=2811482 RepID=UPI001965B20B|nr:AAA family ATPase [Thermoleptolyngbya sp. PKUAC-SCTB121]